VAVATVALVAAAAAGTAGATDGRPVSDAYRGLSRETWNHDFDMSLSAALVAGGDHEYFAPMPRHTGVAALILNHAPQPAVGCAGGPTPQRRSVASAADCASVGVDTP